MKCKNCKACMIQEHAESYEQDFYCICGINDNDRIEFKDDSLGCLLPYNTINNRLNKSNEQ